MKTTFLILRVMSNHSGRSITLFSDDLSPGMWQWASQAGEVAKTLPEIVTTERQEG